MTQKTNTQENSRLAVIRKQHARFKALEACRNDNGSEGAKLESSQNHTSTDASCNNSPSASSELTFERKLTRVSRIGYVMGVVLVISLLTSRVLSPLGITHQTRLVLVFWMTIATIVAGVSYFFLRPSPTREVDEQNSTDSDDSPDPKGETAIQPVQRLSQGCLFLLLWVVIQGVCWWGITSLSWPTRFVPNEIFGGGNQIVIPDAITIAFWAQLFIGPAAADRYKAFSLIQLFTAAFIMSRPSFYHASEIAVDFRVPSYVWVAFWIQFAFLAAALWRLSFKRDATLNESSNTIT